MVVFGKSGCTVLYLFKMFNLGNGVWIPYRRGIQVLVDLACHRQFIFTSGLQGQSVPLIIPKTFEDLEAMSVI